MDVSQAATPAVPTTLRASIQVTKRALELYALHDPAGGGSYVPSTLILLT